MISIQNPKTKFAGYIRIILKDAGGNLIDANIMALHENRKIPTLLPGKYPELAKRFNSISETDRENILKRVISSIDVEYIFVDKFSIVIKNPRS